MTTPTTGPENTGFQDSPQMAYPAQSTATPAEAPKGRNAVGIIALIAAILGIILSCVKGALILSWILLPIAFILGLIGLFAKDKKKGMAIAAIALSILGTFIAVIMFIAVIGSSINEATGGDTTVSNNADGESADGAAANLAFDDGEGSSRENPLPIGTTVENDNWALTVNSVNLNGDEIVAASNEFNEPAGEGQKYIIVNVSITMKADDPAGQMPMGTVEYVTADGRTVNTFDTIVVLENGFDNTSTLYQGGTATGDLAFAVPGDTANQGVLAVRPDMLAGKEFIALQ